MPISENIVHTGTLAHNENCNLGLRVELCFFYLLLQNKLDINKKYAFSKNISYRCVKSKAIVFVSFAVSEEVRSLFVYAIFLYEN